MYKLSIIALIFLVIGCNVPETKTEDIPTGKLDAIEALAGIEDASEKDRTEPVLLAKASFTEPFMYAEIYTSKAMFVFPEKDTLFAEQAFESIVDGKDYEFELKLNGAPMKVKLTASKCIHPGSGETWDRKAEAHFNGESFVGCAQVIRP